MPLLASSARAALIAYVLAAVLMASSASATCTEDEVQLAAMDAQDAELRACLQSTPEIDLSAPSGAGQTALNIAATLGRTRIVKLLLEHKRPPRADAQPDVLMYAPLHTCVQNGHVEAVKLLLHSLRTRPAGVNVQTADGYVDTCLNACCMCMFMYHQHAPF